MSYASYYPTYVEENTAFDLYFYEVSLPTRTATALLLP